MLELFVSLFTYNLTVSKEYVDMLTVIKSQVLRGTIPPPLFPASLHKKNVMDRFHRIPTDQSAEVSPSVNIYFEKHHAALS
jgi:hypothetical protein